MSNIFSTLGAAVKTKIDSAVSDINGDISSVQTDLASEITRAQAAEAANTASIQSNDTDIATNASDISSESTRAQAAEAQNASDISAEASRAATAEAANSTAISSEETRALAAEAQNASDISSEASRAAAAEAANAADIASEATRAAAAEAANASDISSEATRATAAEASLQTQVTSNDSDISDLSTQAGSLAADGNSASFSGDVSAANMVCSGNLTVQGTTTSVETVNLEVKDSIMNISKGASAGANASNDGGFVVERGSSESNVAFVWDEGADRFRAVSTSATAATSDIDAADSSMSYVEMQVSDLYLGTDNLGSISDFTGALNA